MSEKNDQEPQAQKPNEKPDEKPKPNPDVKPPDYDRVQEDLDIDIE